jgi:hypothetical protein
MQRRTLVIAVAGVLTALLFAAVATSGPVPLAEGPPDLFDDVAPRSAEVVVEVEAEPSEEVERRELEPSPLVEAIVRLIFYVTMAFAAVLVAMFLWRHRAALSWKRRRRPSDDFEVLVDVAATVRADAAAQQEVLRRGRPRDAIVACWLRLEQAVIDAGVERKPSDTAAELTERVLAGYQVDPTALARLAGLYREARFSDHEMGEDARRAAIGALDRVHDDLRVGAAS